MLSDPNGVALTFVQFGTTAGTVRASATVIDLNGSPALFELSAEAGPPAQISILSGDGQTETVGQPLSNRLVVEVVDQFGNPIKEAVVNFAPAEGDGSVEPSQAMTDDRGRAATVWTMGTQAKSHDLLASVPVSPPLEVAMSAVATSSEAHTLMVVSGDRQAAAIGQTLPDSLVVRVVDEFGNPVADEPVEFILTEGGGSLTAEQQRTDAEGLVSASLTLASGSHVVEARAGRLSPVSFVAKGFPELVLDRPIMTGEAVELNWSAAASPDFVSYEVRRSTQEPVSATAELLTTITDATVSTYIDNDVQPGSRYYYQIFANDMDGFVLGSNPSSVITTGSLELADNGWDMVYDAGRQRFYVSMPSRNEIAIVSMTSFEVIDTIFVRSRPLGLDLSLDGRYLFAAQNESGSVAVIDLSDNSVEEIILSFELGDSSTFDVLYPQPDVLIVTASPYSSGFAWVVRVDLDFDNGHTARRIASNNIIRAGPVLGKDPTGDFIYIGEGFSPNSLYKIDMNAEGNPIILDDDHGSVSGTSYFAVSPDGRRIYLRSGQILSTDSLRQAGRIPPGIPLPSVEGDLCFVANGREILAVNTTTFLTVGRVPAPGQASRMAFVDEDETIVALIGDLFYVTAVP